MKKSSLLKAWRKVTNPRTLSCHGVRVHCDKESVPRLVRNALFKGIYEKHECHLVRKHLKAGDRVLEIGCGIGLVSILASRICGAGNVFSFEANPEMEPIIRANYALNGLEPNLTMRAVTADGRDLTFHRNDNVLSSSIYDRRPEGLEAQEITISSTAINDALAMSQADAIIMDVEGAEEEILPAADLSRVRVLIIEMHPHIVGVRKISELIQGLQAQGLDPIENQHKNHVFRRADG